MITLKDYVNFKLTHADKTAESNGYPLVMENCKANKKMKQLEMYGNSVQDGTPTPETPIEVQSVGELVTDTTDFNYGKYKIPITVRGENLAQSVSVSVNNHSSYSKNGNSYTIKGNVGTSEAGYDAGQLMIPYASASTISNSGISVQGGETYNISFDCLLKEIGKYNNRMDLLIYYVSSNGSVTHYSITRYYPTVNVAEHYDYIFTAKTTEKIGLCFRVNNNFVTISNIRVENANITPSTTNVYLAEPLRGIGNHADYIDFANDKVFRFIKKQIITGTEVVQLFSGNYPYNFINIGTVGYVIDDVCICNQLQHQSNFSVSREGINTFRVLNSPSNNVSRLVFRLYDNGAPVVTESAIKSLLAEKYANGNPLIFYYGLSEPIEESINCELPKLNNKTSAVEVDTSVLASNAYGKYIKK